MKRVICLLPLVPIRQEPSHRSEMTSQILFGEKAIILSRKDEWIEVKTEFDNYSGWLEAKSVDYFEDENQAENWFVNPFTTLSIRRNGKKMIIPAGSELPIKPDQNSFTINNSQFEIASHVLDELFKQRPDIQTSAINFMNAPYLWGGKSILGIDCSGFMQVIFKIAGIKLPRDAKDQAQFGIHIQKLEDTKPGDLFFFHHEEGNIVHVGMLIEPSRIIHASGSVRIDKIDSTGIFDETLNQYTHQLFSIREIMVN